MERDYNYIQASLSGNLLQDAISYLLEAGVAPMDKHDLHTTVMYDERDIPEPLSILDSNKTFTAKVNGMGKLGDAYVLHLYSPDLTEQFNQLTEDGYKHSYGTPLWHMSLGYKLDDYQILALDQVFATWMGRELTFTGLDYGFKKS